MDEFLNIEVGKLDLLKMELGVTVARPTDLVLLRTMIRSKLDTLKGLLIADIPVKDKGRINDIINQYAPLYEIR